MSGQAPLLAEPCPQCGAALTIVRAQGADVATCACCGGAGVAADRACPHRKD